MDQEEEEENAAAAYRHGAAVLVVHVIRLLLALAVHDPLVEAVWLMGWGVFGVFGDRVGQSEGVPKYRRKPKVLQRETGAPVEHHDAAAAVDEALEEGLARDLSFRVEMCADACGGVDLKSGSELTPPNAPST